VLEAIVFVSSTRGLTRARYLADMCSTCQHMSSLKTSWK